MTLSTTPATANRRAPRRFHVRALVALLALFAAAPAMAAVSLVLNHTDTGFDPVPAGGVVEYTLRVNNAGSSDATSVVLTDTLPANVDYLGATGATCTGPVGGVLTCPMGTIVAYGDATVVVRVRTQVAGTITNSATVLSNEVSGDTGNNFDIEQQTTVNTGADLALAITPDAASVPAGGMLGYTLTVTNNGPDTASSVRVSGSLPPDFQVTGPLPSGCSVSGQLLTCNVPGNIAVGANHAFGPVNGRISAGGGSTLTYAASVTVVAGGGAPLDPVDTNNTVSVDVAVTPGSDLSITKTATTPSPVIAGTNFNYVLTPRYTGDNPSNLVVTDSVPSNFTINNPATFNSNSWACTVVGQLVTCTRAQGGSGNGYNVDIGAIVIEVTASAVGTGIVNQAEIDASTTDPNSSNNVGQASLTVVAPTADLSAHKSGPTPALATAGSPWNWTIRLRNQGPAALIGQAVMTDTLPVGLTVHSLAPNGWSCLPAAPFTTSAGNNTLTCTRDYTPATPLASGANAPSVVYSVSAAVDGTYNNTMCVSAVDSGGHTAPVDNNASNDCAGSGVGVQPGPVSANLRLIKTASPGSLYAGDELTYMLEIINDSPATASDVVLSDTLDNLINNTLNPTTGGVASISVAPGNSSGATCTSTPGPNRRAMSCPFATVPACTQGSTCPVVTVVVRPGGDGGPRINYADVVSTTTADPDYSNNGANVTTTTVQRADVTVTKTATPDPAVAGQDLKYVITARNQGPSRADTVSINDTLPLDVTFVSAAVTGGGGCTTSPIAGSTISAANRQLVCGWTSLGNNVARTVTVTVRPNTVTRGTTLQNDVSIATTTVESDATNNTDTVSVPVSVPALDLLANISDSPDPVAVGDQMVYTLTVTNNGPSYAENVVLSDGLPSDKVSFVSATPTVGTCATVPAAGSFGGTVECNVGGLAAGASASVAVAMKGEAKGTTAGVGNQLTVSSEETRANPAFDTNIVNNVVDEKTTVIPKADVEVVSKTASPGTVGLREAFVYSVVVRNNGVGVSDNTVVSDTLPAGMKLTGTPTISVGNSAEFPTLGVCTGVVGAGSLTCALGDDVAVGATATINVPVIVVTAPVGGVLNNTATISTASKDEVPANNNKIGPVTVQTASLSGRVYGDSNDNGSVDAGETGIAGVTVKLDGTAPDGTAVSLTATTNGSGNYTFTKLPAGTYTVTETQPSGWLDGKDSVGSAGGTAAATPADEISGILLAKDTVATAYNFGELSGGAIAGTVYRDLNNDALIAGAGETGIASVALDLTGIDDLGNPVTATTTTDASGNYSFGSLRPGTYKIVETQPAGYLPGKATVGTGTTAAGTAAVDGDSIDGIVLSGTEQGVSFNFGELPPTGLSGMVYVDANRDGLRDVTETAGVVGVTITLTGTDDRGATVNLTTLTDGAGLYAFEQLRPGTYRITETQPAQWDDGGTNVGTINGVPRGDGSVSNAIGNIALEPGETGIDYDFGEWGQGLAGFVYVDLNRNGVRDPAEPGIAGVTVTVTNMATSVATTALTDASGAYQVNNLPAGNYRISETQPTEYADGDETVGSLGGVPGGNDVIETIPLGVAEMGTGYDFGELAASLAGNVYVDVDGSGTRDPGDAGIAGVTLALTGTDSNGNPVNMTTTSDASGMYSFTGLLPANGSGYTITQTQPNAYADGAENIGNLGGSAGAPGTSVISGIAVTAGAIGTRYDFGELAGGLAGVVFVDANNDGVLDPGEVGIAGVNVRLVGTDVDGKAVDVTVVTGAGGGYLFSGLTKADAAGYAITETQPATYLDGMAVRGTVDGVVCAACDVATINRTAGIPFDPGQAFANFNFPELQAGSLAGHVYDDVNRNSALDADEPLDGITVTLTGVDDLGQPVTVVTTTAADGSYQFEGLRPGTYIVTETQPADLGDIGTQAGSAGGSEDINAISGIVLASGTSATGYDFLDRGGSLHGTVFVDSNGNGVQDPGESGIAGVAVALSGNASDAALTDASGRYRFTGLRAGSYSITETQPTQYVDGGVQVGDQGGTAGADTVTGIALPAGIDGSHYNFPELPPGSLGGLVYRDLNKNGAPDGADETGVADVTVTLTGTDDLGQAVTLTLVTDASGKYRFDGLRPGTYKLVETQPKNLLPGEASPGTGVASPGTSSSDGNTIADVILGVGQTGRDFNFGEWAPTALSGTVFVDGNNDGVRDPGERGIPGVSIRLTGTDADGNPVDRTVVTSADGSYRFEDLPKANPDGYTLTETQPTGYLDGKPMTGHVDGTACSVCVIDTINRTSNVPFDPAKTFGRFDFAELAVSSLTGIVYQDLNGNTRPDGNEGIAGVSVTLTGTDDLGAVVNLTTATGADGSYRFDELRPGTYSVIEAQPVMFVDGGVQVGDSGGTAGTNRMDDITLVGGTEAAGYHFPELPGADGSIAGTVWLNHASGDPLSRDPGEPALEGWIVELYLDGARVPGVDGATTDASGQYLLSDVPARSGYELRFLSPGGVHYGYPVSQGPDAQWNGTVDRAAAIPAITGITVGSGVAVTRQDLPVNPSGVVYDSVTRAPLPGARVTLLDPSGQPVAAQYLAGGESNLTQTTGPDGYYQFLLLPGAPAGRYRVRIEQPDGYLPAPSGIHPPAGSSLAVPPGNTPYQVSELAGPPATGDLPPYYLDFVVTSASAGITGNHIPLDPVLQGALRVRKTTPKINVTKGDLVPYTIELTNTLNVPLANISARDLVPAGFKYRKDSARVDGVPHEPAISGRELSWPDLSFGPNQVRTVQLVLVIGSGVGEGEYVNQAWARNTLADQVVSNIGTAAVRLVPDPTFDCADLIGKVFDDSNGNGYQDQGEPGVPAVRVVTARGLLVTTDDQGRYHIPCAAVPEHARGANFVIKLDERSLPTGYRLTTENPGDVRVTAGKMAKLDFGVTIHRVLRVDVNAAAFSADGTSLLPTWAARLPQLYASAQGKPSVVRIAYHLAVGEDPGRADKRVNALRKQINNDWNQQGRQYPLQVEQEIIEVQP